MVSKMLLLILGTISREEMQEVTREDQAEMLQCNVIPKGPEHLEKAANQKYRGELIYV